MAATITSSRSGMPSTWPVSLGALVRPARGLRPPSRESRSGSVQSPPSRLHPFATGDRSMTVKRATRPLSNDSGRPACRTARGSSTSPDGVRIAFDVYGSGNPTILFMPSAPIIHSRQWKGQVPYLSLHHRRDHLRRSRQRPVRSADRSGFLHEGPHLRRHRGRPRCRRRRSGPCSSGCAATPSGPRSSSPRRNRSGSLGIVIFAVGVPLLSAAPPVACPVLVRGRSAGQR